MKRDRGCSEQGFKTINQCDSGGDPIGKTRGVRGYLRRSLLGIGLCLATQSAGAQIVAVPPNTPAKPSKPQKSPQDITPGAKPQTNISGEQAAIHVMALPPEEEFRDEFQLPPDASPQLVARRNLIDHTNAKINQIADQIATLVAQQSFESPATEIQRLQAIQEAYRQELTRLNAAQEAFRSQRASDVEQRYSDLPAGTMSPEAQKASEATGH